MDISDPDKDRNNYLSEFLDIFSLSNLMNKKNVTKTYFVQQLT